MHELGIASSMFDIILKKARDNSLKKISKISIKVGALSGIDKDFLCHSFQDHLFPGSIAEESKLEINEELPVLKCRKCGRTLNPGQQFVMNCPSCGNKDLEIIRGKDVYVESIEYDE